MLPLAVRGGDVALDVDQDNERCSGEDRCKGEGDTRDRLLCVFAMLTV
jgi:hypothetical protein